MTRPWLAATSAVLLAGSAAAQGIKHTWLMRGTVVEMANGVATLCIGRADGAAPGQVLDVIRITPAPGDKTSGFRRNLIGKVRIEAIVDDHFARARVFTGQVGKHDLVELRRR